MSSFRQVKPYRNPFVAIAVVAGFVCSLSATKTFAVEGDNSDDIQVVKPAKKKKATVKKKQDVTSPDEQNQEIQKETPRETERETEKEKTKEEEHEGYGKTHGYLGPVTVGPAVTLAAIPIPFSAGVEAKYLDIAGASGDYYFFPTVTISSVKVNLSAWGVKGRWFPWRGAFFVSLGAGQYFLKGNKSDTVAGVPVDATVKITTTYIVPQVGWRWVWESGFFMGLELGWQFTLSSSVSLQDNVPSALNTNQTYLDLKNKVLDQGNKYGKKSLPNVTLLRVGWLF